MAAVGRLLLISLVTDMVLWGDTGKGNMEGGFKSFPFCFLSEPYDSHTFACVPSSFLLCFIGFKSSPIHLWC